MRRVRLKKILDNQHKLMNPVVVGTAALLEDAELIIKLDDLMKERGLTQKDLALMTGMRVGTISEFVNGHGISFNKVQIMALLVALRCTSIHELFEIRLPEQLEYKYLKESKTWVNHREMPISVKELYRDNVLKQTFGE